jgi:hypothetical protein
MTSMSENEYIHFLSVLSLADDRLRAKAAACLDDLDEENSRILLATASAHHVVVRAFDRTDSIAVTGQFAAQADAERRRAQRAVDRLYEICQVFEENDCSVCVIKSLDHWPDFGTDLDLLTCSSEKKVTGIMTEHFGASIETPTWSDRVARKRNFRIPELPELVEIHFGRLGQAGENAKLADRVMERRVVREAAGKSFWVPAPEERILLATLQRLYRHYYVRICDIANTKTLIDSASVDFDELRRAAKRAGIWPGVATYLRLVSGYVHHYEGRHLALPRRVWLASSFGIEKVYANAGFLRLPLFPQGTQLYVRQLIRAMRRRDAAGAIRLGLVPPLAFAANIRFKVSGDEHGIW